MSKKDVNKIFDIFEFLKEFKEYLLKKYGVKWDKTYIPYKILEYFCEYYMMISERTDGKTYIIFEMMLYLFLNYDYAGALLRRWDTDIKGETGRRLIDNLIGNNEIVEERTKNKFHNAVEEMSQNRYNTIIYKNRCYYLAKEYINDKNENVVECAMKPFCYVFALSQEEHNKGGGLSRVKIVLYDEFIARDTYLQDEFISFQNTLSTIIRRRTDVAIFMCGNTINRYNPYFEEMGLKHVKNQESGTIDIYELGSTNELHIAVEMIDFVNKKHKKSNKYFAFDNPKLKMVTEGKWEISIYPHLPERYVPKNVLFKYFIIFDGEQFQCDIVQTKTNYFTFIHPFTREIELKDDTLIFDLNAPISIHHRRKINKPFDDIGKFIAMFYQRDKVCYSSNMVGETIRNYLENC